MSFNVLILFIFSTILLVANAEVGQQKRLQTKSSNSNKKSKYVGSSVGKNNQMIEVAVIGGGINAALFTHYLHELINAEVHIYNHRMIEKIDNSGFIVHESQKYMMEIISKFNLNTIDLNRAVVMYDGQKNQVLNIQQNDPIKPYLEFYMKQIIMKFKKIYDDQQKELRSYVSLVSLLKNMSDTFQRLLKISTWEFILEKQWHNLPNIKDIIHTLLLMNFGQNLESNAFAGLTSLIFSQSTGKLRQIITPIDQLLKKLLGNSDKFFDFNISKVTYEKLWKDVFRPQISYINQDGEEIDRIYDYVVIATSEIDEINFFKFNKPIVVCKYRKVVLTTVTASLIDDNFETPNLVTSIANVKDTSSVRLASKISNSEWKIFADDHGGVPNEITTIFNVTSSAEERKTALYPDYSDKRCAIKAAFELHSKLFYLNAIEWASSLLEMKAIGAKNVALRIKKVKDQFSGIHLSRKN